MTILTNTFETFAAIGNREDLTDVIWNISPIDLPLQANIGKTKATAVLHEWQRDQLAAAGSNAQIEGDDSSTSGFFGAVTATVRINNRTQISYKTVIVSGTQDAVNKAGRKKEITLQLMKRSKELKRDCELNLVQTSAAASGNATQGRTMRALESWYGDSAGGGIPSSTNVSRGSGGSSGSATQSPTDGTQRPLTETLLKSVIQAAWTNGGDPDLIMPGPFNKTVISTFTGNNTRIQDTADGKLNSAIDVYVSDFGTHKVVANKFSRDRTLHVLTTDLLAVADLRPFQTIDLAKTGDSEKGMVIREYTLETRNDAGIGCVADLTTS